MRRNHLSKKARVRLFKRLRVVIKRRCSLCRRKLDLSFHYGREGQPECFRHRARAAARGDPS